jgi:hypothetical protein
MDSGFRPSEPGPPADSAGRINQYALVAYIDGKLGDFLFRLRQEIVPGCNLRSHVSILPPRPLSGEQDQATDFVRARTRSQAAFAVTLGHIEVFPVTNVIYIGIGDGLTELHAMHGKFNAEALQYKEPFPYHPHITLAQEIPAADHAKVHELCLTRWREYDGPRQFPVETLTFVQNTSKCGWLDLAETHLEMAGSRL